MSSLKVRSRSSWQLLHPLHELTGLPNYRLSQLDRLLHQPPQDFYKWYYGQTFEGFAADTHTWATSRELRHWRICYGVRENPHDGEWRSPEPLSTSAPYLDPSGWRLISSANNYSPGLLGVLKLPCLGASVRFRGEGGVGARLLFSCSSLK